jgi:hypothetical protein
MACAAVYPTPAPVGQYGREIKGTPLAVSARAFLFHSEPALQHQRHGGERRGRTGRERAGRSPAPPGGVALLLQKVTGALFVGLGLWLAVTGLAAG